MKKNTNMLLAFLGVILVVGIILSISTIGPFDVTNIEGYEPVIINGEHIQTYDELREISGLDSTDEEFENSGIIKESEGLYARSQTGVINE